VAVYLKGQPQVDIIGHYRILFTQNEGGLAHLPVRHPLRALDSGLTGGCFGNSSVLGGHSLKAVSYHFMWPEGKDKVVCPWHEGNAIVPPNNWFHHTFVLSPTPARVLALHRSRLHPGLGDNVVDYERNEFQYWQRALPSGRCLRRSSLKGPLYSNATRVLHGQGF